MNRNKLISIDDLPTDIQEELRRRYEYQQKIELRRKQSEELDNIKHQNITVNNHNTYYINILKNKGVINEREESNWDWLAKAIGRAAGKTYAEFKNGNRR